MVSAAWVSCRSAIRSAWARLSRSISRSCAFCVLRSVNVRQMRSSPSTASGESPDQHGDDRAVAVEEIELGRGAETVRTDDLVQTDRETAGDELHQP